MATHSENIGARRTDRPCWTCRCFVALSASGSATCLRRDQPSAVVAPEGGCAFHAPDPARAGAPRPEPVSFLDAWALLPKRIPRPPEVLAMMRASFRVLVACGGADDAAAFAALDRADRKRRITVVIHAGDPAAVAWGLRRQREVLGYATGALAKGRPDAAVALPGGGAPVADMVRQARAAGLPVWTPGWQVLDRLAGGDAEVPSRPMPGWRPAEQHQWSRDPGRGHRYA